MNETDMLNVKLVVVGGAPEGDEFRLKLPCVLGRSKGASVPLPHPLVSRQHCQLDEKDGNLVVRDLGSTNGTFVGSERIDDECTLRDGDLLTIGTVTFRAVYVENSTESLDEEATQTEQERTDAETTTIQRMDVGTNVLGVPHHTHRPQKAK